MVLTAGAPTSRLMSALALAYWGSLAGREWRGVRDTFLAIGTVATGKKLARGHFDKAGTVRTTAPQLGDIAGYSERWTRRCLQILEELGIISWRRGMVVDGVPTVSVLRVDKKTLVELIEAARPGKDLRLIARRREFDARLARCNKNRVVSRGAKNARTTYLNARLGCSDHAELSADLTPHREGEIPQGLSLPPTSTPDIEAAKTLFAAITTPKGPENVQLPPRPDYDPTLLPTRCEHEYQKQPDCCLWCIEAATPPHQLEMWKKRVRALTEYVEPEKTDTEIIEERISQLATERAISEGYTMADMVKRSAVIAQQLRERYQRQQSPAFLWE